MTIAPDLASSSAPRGLSWRCRALLAVSPWTWPDDPADVAALCAAAGAPPTLPPGAGALVAFRKEGIELWRFDIGPAGATPPGVDEAPLLSVAEQAFSNAATAVERRLPFSAADVVRFRAQTRRAVLAGVVCSSKHAVALRSLDGPSFGLSFALAMASRVLQRPVKASVVASACVDMEGHLEKVEGIREKISGVRRLAPRIRSFLVAEGQFAQDELRELNARVAPLEVIPCRDLLHALEHAIDDRFADLSEEQVAAFVPDLFLLALRDRGSLVSWRSVSSAARALLPRVRDDGDVQRLRLVDMIAGRHGDHQPPADWPKLDHVERQRRPLRLQLLAHLVQEHHDLGWPEDAWLRPQVEAALSGVGHWAHLHDASPAELMLAGAWGRVLALRGRLDEALALQLAAQEAFFECGELGEVSHPLCEALRFSALLGDEAAFDALVVRRDALVRLRPREDLSGYLDLAVGRGQVLLGRHDHGAASLRRLVARRGLVRDHVCDAAVRWLVAAERAAGGTVSEHTASLVRNLQGATSLLVKLDAVGDGDPEGMRLLEELGKEKRVSTVVGHLRRAFSTPREVARHYPY